MKSINSFLILYESTKVELNFKSINNHFFNFKLFLWFKVVFIIKNNFKCIEGWKKSKNHPHSQPAMKFFTLSGYQYCPHLPPSIHFHTIWPNSPATINQVQRRFLISQSQPLQQELIWRWEISEHILYPSYFSVKTLMK